MDGEEENRKEDGMRNVVIRESSKNKESVMYDCQAYSLDKKVKEMEKKEKVEMKRKEE